MSLKKNQIFFLILSLSTIGAYSYFSFGSKTLMYNLPNGVYNIKRISCPEDLNKTNDLISRADLATNDFELTFSLSLDFDDIIKRELVIHDHEGRIAIESKDCKSEAHFKISRNSEYLVLFDLSTVDLYTQGSCKFKKTFQGKTYYINKYGHFAIEQDFFSGYWLDKEIPLIEWSPRMINNRIILKARYNNIEEIEDIPCSEENNVVWEVERLRDI